MGPAGAVHLQHDLVLEDATNSLGRRPLTDDHRPLVVKREAAGMRGRAVGCHPHVTVLRLDTVERYAPDEQVPRAIECGHGIACVGVRAVERGRTPLRRRVLRVPGDDRVGPMLAAVRRIGEAFPASAQVREAVVVPAGHDGVGIGGVDQHGTARCPGVGCRRRSSRRPHPARLSSGAGLV